MTKNAGDTSLLNELVTVCEDGRGFYRYAADEVRDNELRRLFRDMADIRDQIARDLSRESAQRGSDPPAHGSLPGRMRALYTDIKAQLVNDPDYNFVIELERSEAEALDEFRGAVQSVSSSHLAEELARHLATIQLTHDRMEAVKDEIVRRRQEGDTLF